MVTRKKKNLIICLVVFFVVMILAIAGLVYLYFMTDLLKSNKEMFEKNISLLGHEIYDMKSVFYNTEIDGKLEQNKYIEKTKVKVNHTVNNGTSVEDKSNYINKLKLTSEGKVSLKDGFKNRLVTVYDENPMFTFETLERNQEYGIRFPTLYKQFLVENNSNAKKILKEIGYTDEELDIIPKKVKKENIFLKNEFSEEGLDVFIKEYLSLIDSKVSKDKFYKKTGLNITINKNKYPVTEYSMKVRGEEFNNLRVDYLEKIKKDERFLKQFNSNEEKDKFVSDISKKQDDIRNHNIGNDSSEISLYSTDSKLLKVVIKNKDIKVNIDIIKDSGFYKFQIDKKNENIYSIEINGKDSNYKVNVSENVKGVITEKEYTENLKLDGKKAFRDIYYKVSKNTEKTEASISNEMEFKEFDINIPDDDIIKIEDVSKDLRMKIFAKYKEKAAPITEGVKARIVSSDVLKVFNILGLVDYRIVIEGDGTSEIEKSRHNSKYEIFIGEDLDEKIIKNMIEALKDEITKFESQEDGTILISLNQGDVDTAVMNKFEEYLKVQRGKKYAVSLKYDNKGFVNGIVVKLFEK